MQQASAVRAVSWRTTVGAYVNLLKPHVTVLLLGTTLAAMVVAANGMPPFGLVLATLIGGAAAAGSAHALNCFLGRAIDAGVSRPPPRPPPPGRVAANHPLAFGLSLAALSFFVLARFVNLLAALLAFSAIVFYVVIYTMWLKRSTPQNIVIGGAAGAVPVLVGWAAVTNSVGITPLWMF